MPTSNVRREAQRSSGSAEALPVQETLGLLSRGIAAFAETVAGRGTQQAKKVGRASRRLIQERSHISAAIKHAPAAQWAISIESMLKRDTSSGSGTERLEVEANQFAAALLMPGFILEELLEQSPIDIEDGSAMEIWAKDFVVSRAALQYRIRNL